MDSSDPTPTQPIRRTKIVRNGHDGVFEVHYGTVVKGIVSLVVSCLLALVTYGIPALIRLNREIGEVRAGQITAAAAAFRASEEAAKVGDKLDRHIQWSLEEVPKLATKEELNRALAGKQQ